MSKRERISVLVAQGDDALREEVEAILAKAEDVEVVGVTRTGDAHGRRGPGDGAHAKHLTISSARFLGRITGMVQK